MKRKSNGGQNAIVNKAIIATQSGVRNHGYNKQHSYFESLH